MSSAPSPAAELITENVVARQGRRERSFGYLLFLVPALAFLAVLFAYPLLDMLFRSVTTDAGGMTIEHYQRVVNRPVYLKVFWITIEIAFFVTILTLLISYPLAYVLATVRRQITTILMIFILVPFFTSILVRTYAWMVILGPDGVINEFLHFFGLGGVTLLYNRAGVLIGMTYALTPYMTLTLYSVMRGIDRHLLQAAHSLGAGDWQAFRRIFFPLSLPGVTGGSLLVFILSLGYFITPRLLGGRHDQMVAMIIDTQVELALNWHFAAALAAILLVITLIGFVIYDRLVGLQSLFESKS